MPTLRFTPSSLLRAILVVGGIAVVVMIVARAVGPVMWFVEASVVAALAWPVLQRMSRHMSSWVAVLVLTGAILVVIGTLSALAFSELEHEAERFRDTVPSAVRELQREGPVGGVLEDLKVADQIDRMSKQLADRFELGADLPGIATAVGGKVSTGFIVWVLTVMLVFTGPGMVQATVDGLPEATAEVVRPSLARAYGSVVRYLGLTTVRAIVVGAAVSGVAWVLGIDMPILLGAVAAVSAFVPYVGVFLGALPLALLAVLNGAGEALAVLAGALAAQTLDSLLVQPRIDRRSFRFGMFPTLVSTIIGYSLFGVAGLFLALFAGAMVLALLVELGPRFAGTTSDGDGPLDADADAVSGTEGAAAAT